MRTSRNYRLIPRSCAVVLFVFFFSFIISFCWIIVSHFLSIESAVCWRIHISLRIESALVVTETTAFYILFKCIYLHAPTCADASVPDAFRRHQNGRRNHFKALGITVRRRARFSVVIICFPPPRLSQNFSLWFGRAVGEKIHHESCAWRVAMVKGRIRVVKVMRGVVRVVILVSDIG